MSYPITQKYIQKNRPYTPLNAKGGVIHETANPGDSDELNQKYFANNDVNASAHAFVDSDSITQLIPWNEVAWHSGKTANRQFWGIELCHTLDPKKFIEIWKRGVWLYAHLFTKVAIPPIEIVTKQNLMSHAEVSEKWKETDHIDPISYFAKFGKTVDDFRNDVQKEINQILEKFEVTKNMFSDLDKISNFAKESIGNLANLRIIRGDTDGNFRPKDFITREEVAVIVNNIIKYLEK